MRGYMRKRAKGSWSISVSAGFDPSTGKRRQVYATVRGSKRDAERELTKLLAQADAGTIADAGSMTLETYLRRYLDHVGTRVRPSTLERYEGLARRHIVPRIGAIRLARLRPAHVQSLLDQMGAQGLAARTTLHAYRLLSAALRQAVRWQMIPTNPAAAASPPKAERPSLRVPTPEEIALLIETARREHGRRPNQGPCFPVALVLAISTGMRRGEVLGLAWSEVDLDAAYIRVTRTLQSAGKKTVLLDPKTDRSRRTISLPASAVAVLRQHRRDQAERRLAFGAAWQDLGLVIDRGDGGPYHPDALSRRFRRLRERVGVPEVRFHDLRHAYATTLLEAGVHPKIASEALGHTSVSFTMDTYQHLMPSLGSQAAAAIQAALGAGILGE
jgi:integrase